MTKSTLQVRKHPGTTHRVLTIHWSGYGDTAHRQRVWGGLIKAWQHQHVGDVYWIPNGVPIYKIEAALKKALYPSDRAVLVYVHGKTKRGASALQMRTYNVG